MSQLLWIIDPDPTSAQSMRSAVDLLGPAVETFDHVPSDGELAQAVLIAGAAGADVPASSFDLDSVGGIILAGHSRMLTALPW